MVLPLVLALNAGTCRTQFVKDCSTTPAQALDVKETACMPKRANLNPDVRYFKVF